ncbi:alpha-1,6-mannosyltransferase Och1 [Rhizodiscina lignyota]|uniref:Alpha-1,6-mannosyltransferase Och1 n=1 Tax=Rhizodiscina lignyota TaxID=1504668 RepID=A0A9P4M7U7_9PEZI|nr:alpha-1,6-mannosyltransferase Och1 [Rhizodiscina lignyota]
MNSPTTSIFRNKLSTQIRRVLPVYLLLILLVVIFANASFFTAPIRAASKYKRELRYKPSQASIGGGIPRKIWQTWKTGPLTFDIRDLTTARTWVAKNPQHRYEVLTDDNELEYIEWHYGPHGLNRPDIIELYRSISASIIKADLLRYMIMYAEGGVYADIDVEALRPVNKFIPERYNNQDVDMVIGIEIDQPAFLDHPILGPKCKSFCQWTFMCKPHLPVMIRLIENIQRWLQKLAKERGVPISELELDFNDVIAGTGPAAFTMAVLEQMNVDNYGDEVTWDTFHDLAESKLINGFLVLNVEAFAAGQGHSDSGNHDSRGALVKHHYHASGWPTKHARQKHPVYGEIESCNWEPSCVETWDRNVAEFELWPPEEQSKLIADKNQPPPSLEEALKALDQKPLLPSF